MSDVYLSHVPSGLSCCGDLPWGAHFCHLYETREDLIDTLVPFFAEGLRNNEQCLWVTSAPIDGVDAAAALLERHPELADALTSGQMKVVEYADWYVKTGAFDTAALLSAWLELESQALANGYKGLRATGNTTFLRAIERWKDFQEYEAKVSSTFAGRRLIAMCSYQLGQTSAADVIDVVRNHQFAVARREGHWQVIESAALKAAKQQLHEANLALESSVAQRTAQLTATLELVESQKRALELALTEKEAAQRLLRSKLDDTRLLQRVSAAIAEEGDVQRLFETCLEGAAVIMQSDFASLQKLDCDTGALKLIAHQGFSEEAARHWNQVYEEPSTSCGQALTVGGRVIVEDVEATDSIKNSKDAAVFASLSIRAMQTTPLVSRSGRTLGMLSTHWKRSHAPSERDLNLLDVLARQAADLLERTDAIERLKEKTFHLIEADRRKDEFLATLAHELRNPLAPLRNGVAILQSGRAELAQRVLPMMERQLNQMVRLVDDLLDVSRVSRGLVTLNKECIKLQSVLDVAIETSRPAIDAGKHDMEIRLPMAPMWVDGDITRLAQVLSNLLNNAAKYTPQGGRIVLEAKPVGTSVEISVSDTGIGIPANMLNRVFDMFAQVEEAVSRAQGGLGLGLSVAKTLIEMHGGTIAASSEGRGLGSTFTVCLPLAASPMDARTSGHSPPTEAVSLARILVVDDNEDAAETLALVLDGFGHQTRVVSDSTAALAAAVEFAPHVALLDLGMPQLNGFELAKLLKHTPATANCRLVALSGWGMDEDRRRSELAGFARHLTKPCKLEDLRDTLRELIDGCAEASSKAAATETSTA